jgi:hypothetical protein
MSYAASASLQAAIFAHLSGYPALSGVKIVDAMPPAATAGSFVLIGPEAVRDQSDKTGFGAEHRLEISVISDVSGFTTAKSIAGAVSTALIDADLTLTTGTLISLSFIHATARRIEEGITRRIDMTFRARVQIS